ncbi:MAG: AtpZ/AtpI family protein [Gemmatimonadota bacterium]|nr:AtpZ/AtpI family protein [Gemmatimonadota bacterium]
MTGTPKDPRPSAEASRRASENGPSGAEFAGIGLQFAISILAGVYSGQWLDKKLGSAPWLLIIGVFLGAGLSFYSMYSKLMAAQRREDAAKDARREGQT